MQKYSSYHLQVLAGGKRGVKAHGIENELQTHFKYEETEEFLKRCPLVLETFGLTVENPAYEIRAKRIRTIVIEYILEGEMIIEADGVTKIARKGDTVVLIPPKDEHYYSDKNNPVRKVWVNFHGDMFFKLFDAYDLPDKTVFENVDILEEMIYIQTIDAISNFADQAFPFFLKGINGILYKLYANINQIKKEMPNSVVQIKNLIDYSLGDQIDLNYVSEKTGISKNKLIADFKKYVGKTPKQYMIDAKMERAKIMLQNDVLSIKDIADNLGFGDAFAFSHAFKKHIGCSPREYRLKLLEK